MKLFEPQIPKIEPMPGDRIPGELKDEIKKTGKVSVGETFIKPRIIGGLFEGATFRTAASGARVTILPVDDTTLGIACYDDTGAPVFTTKILGDDIGDVILGNLDEGKYVKWDAGDAMLYINGITLTDFVAVGVATGSDLALQKWTSSLIFTAVDYNTVSWTAGDIRLTGGAVYSIDAGNTGNMSQLTYIYFDSDISSTVLQLSTNPTDTVGANKIQIGVATPNPGAGMNRRAKFQIYSGSGGMIVSVDDLAANDDSTNEFVTATAEISDDIVTYAKIQNMTTARLLGRTSASAGSIEEMQVTTGLSLAAGVLSCTITQATRTSLGIATTDAVTFGNITIGTGVNGVDYTLTFDGNAGDGVITWMEDEDYLKFDDDIMLPDSEAIKFGTGVDMDMYYDGSIGIVHTDLVAPSDLHIDCGTGKTLVLDVPVYKDINMAGALLHGNPTITPDEAQFKDDEGDDTGIYTYAFGIDEGVHGGFELQHDYKETTDLVFHVHWQGIAAPSGTDNVQWRLTYVVARDNVVMADAVTIDSPDTAIDTQYKCCRTDFGAITGTNFKIGDQFMFSLFRVAATGDAYAGDALIETAGIHYQCDTIGSRSITVK